MLLRFRRIVELSHPIHADIPLWPGDPAVACQPVAQIAKNGYFLRQLAIGEHSATHLNAPNSFFAGAAGVEGYSPEQLVRPVVVIDVAEQARADADYRLDHSAVAAWEARFGAVPADCLVLLATGWQARWADPQAFLNRDVEGRFHFPGFGLKVVEWLLNERGIGGVGIDTHGVDGGTDTEFRVNRLVLAGGGLVLENLAHLDLLPPVGATVVVGRLPLVGGSGSPVAVLAFVP